MTNAPSVDLELFRTARLERRRALMGVARGRNLFYAPQGLPATATPAAGVLALAPLDIDRVCVLLGLAADVTTVGSTGAVLRLALYADDGTATFPGALVVDAGTVDATAVASTTLTLAAPIPLAPGRYWIGGASQGSPATAPVIRCLSSTGALTMPQTSNAMSTFNLGASQGSVTGAAPSTFTTAVGYTGTVPRVGAKLN